jgi:(p)ppGpp synthase/HD superfamily hydrolase
MPTLEDAITLATQAHHGQTDKAGAPYILHPLRLMSQFQTLPEQMAAVLHDVVEDSDHTFEELRALGYPTDVLNALDCLTRRDTESYEEFIDRASKNPVARRVKLADLEDNLNICRLTQVTEKDHERLNRYLTARSKLLTLA